MSRVVAWGHKSDISATTPRFGLPFDAIYHCTRGADVIVETAFWSFFAAASDSLEATKRHTRTYHKSECILLFNVEQLTTHFSHPPPVSFKCTVIIDSDPKTPNFV